MLNHRVILHAIDATHWLISTQVMDNWIMRMAQSGEDGAVPLLYCCVAPGVENGDLIEPEHNGKLMPRMYGSAKKWDWGSEASTTADKEAFWAASEAAAGKWDF